MVYVVDFIFTMMVSPVSIGMVTTVGVLSHESLYDPE
jgi:hypothetical protein